MKKLAVLIALLVLTLAGCGSSGSSQHKPSAPRAVGITGPIDRAYIHGKNGSKFAAPPVYKGPGPTQTWWENKTGRKVKLAAIRPPVPKLPLGPTSTGWHVAYADSFAVPIGSGIGQDAGWKANTHTKGCCGNGNEIATELPSKIKVGEAGLEAFCTKESNNGFAYTCGGADTSTPAGFTWKFGGGQSFAFQVRAKVPPASGCGEDPGWWGSDPTWTDEIDFFEMWGYNAACKYSGGLPVWIYKTPSSTIRIQCQPWEGCESWIPHPSEWHTYTTVVDGSNRISEYIDGQLKGTVGPPPASINTPWDHLIVSHALRERSILTESVYQVAYAAVYEIGNGNTQNEGLAPGTTVSGEPTPEPKPEPEPTTTKTTPPPPPPPPAPEKPAAPTGVTAASISTSTSPGTSIKWTAVAGATSYKLYRAGNENIEGRKPGEQWGGALSSASATNHQLVTAGGWYCYRVAAINANGQGPFSAPACATA